MYLHDGPVLPGALAPLLGALLPRLPKVMRAQVPPLCKDNSEVCSMTAHCVLSERFFGFNNLEL